MKKFAVLVLSAMMLFAIAASSLANSLSLGYMVNGKDRFEITDDGRTIKGKGNARNLILSGNFDINDKFAFSGELTDCDVKGDDFDNYETLDHYSYKLKGNYAIFQNEQARVDLSAGYLYRELSAQHYLIGSKLFELKYNSFIFGANATCNLAENMDITVGFEYGLSPEVKGPNNLKKDCDLLNYQVDFNYYVTENVGLSLGYHSSCWDIEDATKDTIAGITTGVTYKF